MAEARARVVSEVGVVGTHQIAPPTKQSVSHGATLVGIATLTAIAFGFVIRNRELIVPGEGLGYRLGLYGGLTMLALLAYPVFKRTRLFGDGKKAASVFRLHMLLGIIGPVMIFFHTNFSIGALNSNIALFSMILVAVSGVVGRYIYVHVYAGLSGARYDMGTLLTQATRLMSGIEQDVGGSGGLVSAALADFSSKTTPKEIGLWSSLRLAVSMPFHLAASRKRIMREVSHALVLNGERKGWSAQEKQQHYLSALNHVGEFLVAVSRAAQLTFWERMFSLWHVLHVPLFFLLLVSGVVHVVAVHLY